MFGGDCLKYFGEGLSEKHKELNSIIRKKDYIDEAKEIFLYIHAELNQSSVYGTSKNEVDLLLEDLKDYEYAIMPGSKDESIAWVIWHIARIEDLTMNLLVNRGEQVFSREWQERLNVGIKDTGNALTDEEIIKLSSEINITQILEYRKAVAIRTREIVKSLGQEDMKRNIDKKDLDRIYNAGGVTGQEDSIWLLDFWGGKDVAGILLMPPTRHVILHLNSCCRWKEEIRTRGRYYMIGSGGKRNEG